MRGSCIACFWTQGFSTIYMGKQAAPRFGQMVRRIQDWLILIPSGNRVYHLPKSVSFNEGRESLRLIFKKGWKTWKPNFRLKVSNQEDQENRRMPFQTFRLFQEFSTETSKATRNWVNGKPGKAPKCPLSLFERVMYIFGIHLAFFSVLRARKGKNFEKNYCTNT